MNITDITNQTIFQESPISTQIFSPQGDSLMVNKAWERLWGVKHQQILGYNILKDQRLVEKGVMSYIKKGFSGITVQIPAVRYELHRQLPSMSLRYRWVSGMMYPVRDKKGTIVQLVLQQQDVTEKKKYERQQDEFIVKLQESEDRFRALIENGSDVIILSNGKGAYSYVSPSIQHVLGYSPEEFIALTRKDIVHPDDLKSVVQDMERLVSERGGFASAKFRLKHKNGSWRWIESKATNLLHTPSIKAVVSNLRDVHEREVLARQKDEFIAIVSHELKTPLTSIKVYTQLLMRRFLKLSDIRSADVVGKMDTQLNKLGALISDLLDVTKIEGGKFIFKKDYFDCTMLIEEVVEEMQRTTEKHTLLKKLDGIVYIYGDRDRIGQVLINLLANAIKYSPAKKKIVVKTTTKKNAVIISVQDFGIGLSKKDQSRIFERFYRVDEKGLETYPGLGLGLYISKEIVERHHGKIWVESEKGKGTTFHFSLPISKG